MTILEGVSAGVLAEDREISRLHLSLGSSWRDRGELEILMARIGLLASGSDAAPMTVELEDRELVVTDPFGGALDGFEPDGSEPIVVSGDGMELLVLGLDEWIRVVRERVREASSEETFAYEGEEALPIRLPVLQLKPLRSSIHPRIQPIAERLRRRGIEIKAEWRKGARPVAGFVDRLTESCIRYKEDVLRIEECGTYKEVEYPQILPLKRRDEGVWEALRERKDGAGRSALDRALPSAHRHGMFGNLKSSQAFAINVLFGLHEIGLLAAALDRELRSTGSTIEELRFEYFPLPKREMLGETGPHYTQIDAVVWWRSEGRREALVIEVKLCESEFGRCSGPTAPSNPRRDVCSGSSEQRRDACYLRTDTHRRTYLDHLEHACPDLVRLLGRTGACPLRADGYQLARNLIVTAWLRGLLETPFPPPEGDAVERSRFLVLSAAETPALMSPALKIVEEPNPRERLGRLGAHWIDARRLVEGVADQAAARDLVTYLRQRYEPVFA